MTDSLDTLIRSAREMMKKAHAPYSNFKVGAAVMTTSGNIYGGCNIENASYSLTCCAERVAIFSAIADGDSNFFQMAITASSEKFVPPCGACLQVMSEFVDDDFPVTLITANGARKALTLADLLPTRFSF